MPKRKERTFTEDQVRAIVDRALANCVQFQDERSDWSRGSVSAANDMAWRIKSALATGDEL